MRDQERNTNCFEYNGNTVRDTIYNLEGTPVGFRFSQPPAPPIKPRLPKDDYPTDRDTKLPHKRPLGYFAQKKAEWLKRDGWNNWIGHYVSPALVLCALVLGGAAQAAVNQSSATANVSLQIYNPILITTTSHLTFPPLILDGTPANATMNESGAVSVDGTAVIAPGVSSPMSFQVSGTPGASWALTSQLAPVTLSNVTNGQGNTILVDTFTSTSGGNGQPQVFAGNGISLMSIGATAHTGGIDVTSAGNYFGQVVLTVAYE